MQTRKSLKDRMRAAFERRYGSKGSELSFFEFAPNRWRVTDVFNGDIQQDFDTAAWRIRAINCA